MFFRKKRSGSRTYLQIVENRWDKGRVRQRVVATLGRLDELQESGQLDRLLRSGARFSEHALVLLAHSRNEVEEVKTHRIGPPLVFERLWRETLCQEVISSLLRDRRFGFPVERAIFLTVLHRIMKSGSDRDCERRFRESYLVEGIEGVELHQLYRAMAWLGEELEEKEQVDATPFAPRCVKDLVEERLFERRRDLFTSLDVVFFDTTSIYFEGEGGQMLGRRGKSKDHRPDLKQMVVGVVLDNEGRPICCEMWPGNTADVKALLPVVERLRKKFGVGRVCIVSDRGMISKRVLLELEERGIEYIVGARMRSTAEVRDEVLSRAGRYQVVHPQRKDPDDPSPLKVKEVVVDDRRYVVCLNEEQARKDQRDREAILASLRKALRQGDKSLVGNDGFRRYLTCQGPHFRIDETKVAQEARYDGKWVLRTNTTLSAAGVALKYKQLWMVERVFRNVKSLLKTRPIFHRIDETIRGHVFCSFLALLLTKELQDRLVKHNCDAEWPDVLADLDALTQTEVVQNGKHFIIRSDLRGSCGKVFQAVGVAIPPSVRQMHQPARRPEKFS